MQTRRIPDDVAARARASEQQRNAALLRAATDLFALDPNHDADQRRRYETLALHFIPLVQHDDRLFVAERLAAHGDVPRAVICALARDHIEVAAPVLRRSTVLTPVDLLATIAVTGIEHHRIIAGRADLAPEVRHALHLTGDPDVLASLGKASATDASTPAGRTGFYYASTTRDPWRFLSLDRRARLRLIAEIASYPPAFGERASAAERADRAFRSILGAARIVGFARSGQLDAIIDTIAESLDLSKDLVSVAVSDAGGEALAVMLKAMRLDDTQARQVLLLASPAGRESGLFFQLSDVYAGMEPEVAEVLVASWRHATALKQRAAAHQPHFAEAGVRGRGLPSAAASATAVPEEKARRA